MLITRMHGSARVVVSDIGGARWNRRRRERPSGSRRFLWREGPRRGGGSAHCRPGPRPCWTDDRMSHSCGRSSRAPPDPTVPGTFGGGGATRRHKGPLPLRAAIPPELTWDGREWEVPATLLSRRGLPTSTRIKSSMTWTRIPSSSTSATTFWPTCRRWYQPKTQADSVPQLLCVASEPRPSDGPTS